MHALRRKIIILMMGLNIFVGAFSSLSAETTIFTMEELDYIKNKEAIKVMAFHGGAPIQYVDQKGEVKGIAIEIMDVVSEISGLEFDIYDIGTLEEALIKEPEIYLGLSSNYYHDRFYTTDPFLKSETSLFINKYMDFDKFDDLQGKRYVRVKSSQALDRFQDFQQESYATRLETIESVHKDKNNFGIGNDFTIAFYLASGLYNNVVTVPIKGATRTYHFGFLQNDEQLINIMNKSIEAISDTQLQGIVIAAITEGNHGGKLITFFNQYNQLIFMIVFVALFGFIYISYKLKRASSRLHFANQEYELLSEFSGELLFEYNLQTKTIDYLGKKALYYSDLFPKEQTRAKIIETITEKLENKEQILELENIDGDIFYLRIKQFIIRDKHDHMALIFGSILDVTERVKEIEILEYQSRIDGLTNLYNARYTKEKITNYLNEKDEARMDAMILIDLDDFKLVNDRHGHLKGDAVLRNVAMVLNVTFETASIIGRYGGDEFIVYLKDVSSCGVVRDLSYQLIHNFRNTLGNMKVTPSIGISMVTSQTSFEDIFEEVDRAMYTSKNNGKNHVVIYQENLNCVGDKNEK